MIDAPVYITITYDQFTPNVEAQITRDFLAMQTACPNTPFYCIAPDEKPKLALNALGISLCAPNGKSNTLIQYKVGKHFAPRPKGLPFKSTIIDRDMETTEDELNNKLDLNQHPGYYLPDLSRPYISDINKLRSPPNNGMIPPNPALIYLWGP